MNFSLKFPILSSLPAQLIANALRISTHQAYCLTVFPFAPLPRGKNSPPVCSQPRAFAPITLSLSRSRSLTQSQCFHSVVSRTPASVVKKRSIYTSHENQSERCFSARSCSCHRLLLLLGLCHFPVCQPGGERDREKITRKMAKAYCCYLST